MLLTEFIVARWQAGDMEAMQLLADYETALTQYRDARTSTERELARLSVERCEIDMRRMVDQQ